MENKARIQELLQKVVIILYKAEKMEEECATLAQRIGLQGEKRRLRARSVESHNLINYIICDNYDYADISLDRAHDKIEMEHKHMLPKAFFELYLEKLMDQSEALHTIANGLVANNYSYGADPLYCLIKDKLAKDIKYYHRTIKEGNDNDWNWVWLSQHQTTAENIHDEFQKEEKKLGYPG